MHERLRNPKGSVRTKEEKVGRGEHWLRKGVMRVQMKEKGGERGHIQERGR